MLEKVKYDVGEEFWFLHIHANRVSKYTIDTIAIEKNGIKYYTSGGEWLHPSDHKYMSKSKHELLIKALDIKIERTRGEIDEKQKYLEKLEADKHTLLTAKIAGIADDD